MRTYAHLCALEHQTGKNAKTKKHALKIEECEAMLATLMREYKVTK
jgi:hypothetical protein